MELTVLKNAKLGPDELWPKIRPVLLGLCLSLREKPQPTLSLDQLRT
jgi:hypothetical protein